METDIKSFKDTFIKECRGKYSPQLYVYESIGSTNDTLIDMAKDGCEDGSVIVALSQTNGHGRSGRSFFSPPGGNLYMSILIRNVDIDRMSLVTPAGAVATLQGIKDICNKETGIKWVNDLYFNSKKICGILAQAYNISTDNQFIVIGIGINVREIDEDVPADIKNVYGFLYEKNEICLNESIKMIRKLAASIYCHYMDIYKNHFSSDFMKIYRKYSMVINKEVSYLSGDEECRINVTGIDDMGALITRDSNGNEKKYSDGEIRIRL